MESNDTRERLVAAMADALQRRGLHGMGLTELLAQAQAPKGVLYHHFPGGKAELAVTAITESAQRMVASLDKALKQAEGAGDPLAALHTWLQRSLRQLSASGFERGCPLATVALESTPDDTAIRAALAQAFAAIRASIAAAFAAAGQPAEQADGTAALIVAAYEGGLMQARVSGSAQPMAQVLDTLIALLQPRPAPRARR
jgi:TetR/AcrR family transcriptional regulator, lmrAB and yxaGH operons repressor